MKNEIYIDVMRTDRCKARVKRVLKKHGHKEPLIVSNSVWIDRRMTKKQHKHLGVDLKKHGFVLHSHRNTFLVNETKRRIKRIVNCDKIEKTNMNFSDFLSAHLGLNYKHLNNLFHKGTGNNISSFIILQKVERAKVLLIYTKISLGKIAKRLGYSRSGKFSDMFKSVMKMTPKTYRRRYGKALGCVSKA